MPDAVMLCWARLDRLAPVQVTAICPCGTRQKVSLLAPSWIVLRYMKPLLKPCLLLVLALAPAGFSEARAAEAVYQVTQTGIPVVEITAQFETRPDGYWMRSVSRAVGIGRLFAQHEIRSEVEGAWHAEGVAPQRYQAEGNWRGDARRTVLLYREGMPQPLDMEPPEGTTNEPVPLPARRGTIDMLSAFALMSRMVTQTGRCDVAGPIFDGRRRLDWSSRTIGAAQLTHAGQQVETLQCGLESRLIAGVRHGDDRTRATQPRQAMAWLAKVDQRLPPIPVRVEFPSTIFGTMRMELRRIK
ncbi:MAG: DUF3108 domain-containing protein [Alphaproteobacteria bacterium]|nr:DUF3108 domain-containing protein [Alphaproteobacteria bacterium]